MKIEDAEKAMMVNKIIKFGAVFVIVSWNNRDIISGCIESVLAQDYAGEVKIILVDNDSKDKTADFVENKFPEVIVLRQSENTGFAMANNIGIDYTKDNLSCDYVALLNSDARVDNDWLANLIEFFVSNDNVASAQGVTYDYFDNKILDSRGILVNRNGSAIQLGFGEPSENAPDKPVEVFGVNAAACVYSMEFFKSQPLSYIFDNRMYMYLEDVDLAARLRALGYKSFVVPAAKAQHMGSASSKKRSKDYSYYMVQRNNIILVYKNFYSKQLVRLMIGQVRETVRELGNLWKTDRSRIVVLVRARLTGAFMVMASTRDRNKIKKHSATQAERDRVWQELM